LTANMPTAIRAIRGDITTLAVDAVVNAANSTLLGPSTMPQALSFSMNAGGLGDARRAKRGSPAAIDYPLAGSSTPWVLSGKGVLAGSLRC
jgi:hypothetical protein